MTGVIVLTFLTVLCAVGVLAAAVVAQRPEEGWRAWFRSAFRSWRRDDLSWDSDVDDEAVGGLGTLYLMSEPGSAYTRPEELGGGLVRPRGHRPGGAPSVQIELAPPTGPAQA